MKTQTMIELVRAYARLAEVHRQAAKEYGIHSWHRGWHAMKATEADDHGSAWTMLAETITARAVQEVRHG